MSKAYKCDKCGAVIEGAAAGVIRGIRGEAPHTKSVCYELCQNCFESCISHWLLSSLNICNSYDLKEGRCNGTQERDYCSCEGIITKCNFYPEKRNK